MKKMNQFFSFLMAAVMLFTTCGTASAAALFGGDTDPAVIVETIEVSDTVQLEMRLPAQPGEGQPFEVRQIENGELVQIVSCTVGGEYLTVTNYKDGLVTSVESLRVADRVTKADDDTTLETGAGSVNAGAMGGDGILGFGPGFDQDPFGGDGTLPLSTVTYNTSTVVRDTRQVEVYSKLTDKDYESFTINGEAADTLSVVIGLAIGVGATFVPAANIVQQIVIAIISGLGGSILGGAIGVAVREVVAVEAYYYDMWGYYPTNRSTSQVRSGVARHVLTKNSSFYDEWFYEDYTPYTWQDMNRLAERIWMDFFPESFPGVWSYS